MGVPVEDECKDKPKRSSVKEEVEQEREQEQEQGDEVVVNCIDPDTMLSAKIPLQELQQVQECLDRKKCPSEDTTWFPTTYPSMTEISRMPLPPTTYPSMTEISRMPLPGAFPQEGPGLLDLSSSTNASSLQRSLIASGAHRPDVHSRMSSMSDCNDLNLPQAVAISESPEDLEMASRVDNKRHNLAAERKKSNASFVLFCVSTLVLVAALTLILTFTMAPDEMRDATENQFTLEQTQGFQRLESLLPQELLEPFWQERPSSAQRQAYDWLSHDPHLDTLTEMRATQRYALATLFFPTQGSAWNDNDHWLSYDYHECDWHSGDEFTVFFESHTMIYPCNNETGAYERLWLPNNNLNGTLPDEVYSLSHLQSMEFIWNGDLLGTITPKIQQLTNLEMLSFGLCQMKGTIPSEIGLLAQLRIFYLTTVDANSSKIHGNLPAELTNLRNLEQITFAYNDISGTIPTGLGADDEPQSAGIPKYEVDGPLAFGDRVFT